ncbi:hypothetical protein GOP47_0015099 [Adiantum capillus-veneris]|uniref:Pentatricopeptide repeat-containing protein n=1 Tax=Adiantum capillus-veneris TaxID=13818 RepID=A0A9D4UNE4_ADICA|nr:hypothetical protein GOP47_0015099 [Adiantum capillus-veneris]
MNGTRGCTLPSLSLQPSVEEILFTLQKCRKKRDLEQALYLHVYICNLGLDEHRLIGNNLVSLMVDIGRTCDAQHLFDRHPYRSERAWTSMITGYIEAGKLQHAFTLYSRLGNYTSVQASGHTFVALLKACSKLKDVERGLTIHAEIMRMGSTERDRFVGSALVDMYAKCDLLNTAQEVLDQLPLRDVVSWTALIAGYADYGHYEDALECLREMQQEGVTANTTTFVCCLKACGRKGALCKGQEIHAEVERLGLSRKDIVLDSALVDMYCKHGSLAIAQEVFDKISVRNAVSWTTLIVGYTEHGWGEEALACFEQMLAEGISADHVVLMSSLKACGKVGAMDKGEDIHAEVERRGLLDKDLAIGNALVDMYVRCGSLSKAQEVFDNLRFRSVVSWTTLLAGYANQPHADNVLKFLERMQVEGVLPDAVALVCSLQACSNIGATSIGVDMHAEIERKGLLERDLVVGNSLVDMYAKCGFISRAHEVFDKLPVRDVVSWTSLISGYAQLGESEDVCCIFEKMVGAAINPDPVTFIIVLDACGRKGLCDRSEMYYEAMSRWYGIAPTLAHHTGMVGLFCRAGRFEKATSMIQKIQSCPNSIIWHIVLDACRKWGNVGLGLQAFEHALHLDEKDAGVYVSMSRIYADAFARSQLQEQGTLPIY